MKNNTQSPSPSDDVFGFIDDLKLGSLSEEDQIDIHELVDNYLPPWFIPMLNDVDRNVFYQKMIKRHVKDKVVLEIGAGIGLQCKEAAKAGAKHVYACEMNPFLYALAKKNIEDSPYKDKITLFNLHSDDLEIGKQLPAKVDIILSELLASDVFSEKMISSFQKATRLLKKDGLFLPGTVDVYGALVEIKDDLVFEARNTEIFPEILKTITEKRSNFFNLGFFKFRALSRAYTLLKVTDGLKLSHEFPLTIKLKTKDKMKSKNTFFCLYFSIKDGRSSLANLDLSTGKNTTHWGNALWRLDPNLTEYNIKLILKEEKIYLFNAP